MRWRVVWSAGHWPTWDASNKLRESANRKNFTNNGAHLRPSPSYLVCSTWEYCHWFHTLDLINWPMLARNTKVPKKYLLMALTPDGNPACKAKSGLLAHKYRIYWQSIAETPVSRSSSNHTKNWYMTWVLVYTGGQIVTVIETFLHFTERHD